MNDYGPHLHTEEGGEEVDFTQRETFGWLALALALAVAVTLAPFVIAVVSIIWPLFLAAVK